MTTTREGSLDAAWTVALDAAMVRRGRPGPEWASTADLVARYGMTHCSASRMLKRLATETRDGHTPRGTACVWYRLPANSAPAAKRPAAKPARG